MLPKFKGTKYEEALKRVNLHARVRLTCLSDNSLLGWVRDELTWYELTRHHPEWVTGHFA